MILLSLPVHESVEVVLDQVANLRRFAPDAHVIIHPARQFLEASDIKAAVAGLGGVILNEKPIYTAFGTVMKCHVSNFLYAEGIGLDFTHFCHHSSNDMLVRDGVEKYVTERNFGFQKIDAFMEEYNFSFWRENFRDDKAFSNMLEKANRPSRILCSQVEGTFFPRDAYQNFARDFMKYAWKELGRFIPYAHGTHLPLLKFFDKLQKNPRRRKYCGKYFYPREEFYLSNYFSHMVCSPAPPYCLMDWDNQLKVKQEQVDLIRSGKNPIDGYDQLFAVKRVGRSHDDPLRSYIRHLGKDTHTSIQP